MRAKKTTSKKEPSKMGRPRKEVDLLKAQQLANLMCTGEEIAAVLEVDYDTLVSRIEEQGLTFSEWYKKAASEAKASLRRQQWLAAKDGNVTMLIWLGKNMLGQTDKQEIQHSGTTQMRVTVDDLDD